MQKILRKFKSIKGYWGNIADWILRWRLPILLIIVLLTAMMSYIGRDVPLKYEYTPIAPETDPDVVNFRAFKSAFGEDGNVFVMGMKDERLFELKNFQQFYQLCQDVRKLSGIREVISLSTIQRIRKDDSLKRFKQETIFGQAPTSQTQLDTLLKEIRRIKLYEGQLFNAHNSATVVAITIEKKVLNSAKRLELTPEISKLGDAFSQKTGIQVHYSGLPHIRSVMTSVVKKETVKFLVISLLVTALVILVFFRSWEPLLISMLLIGAAVMWSMGSMVMLGYEITILTGLMPPILVIIAIPNSVYLINKYQQEYLECGDKKLALRNVIVKIGFLTVIVNLTTAIGFIVFVFGGVEIMSEFGLVISINIMITFLLSIFLIPIFYSYLPAPSPNSMRHLEFKPIRKFLEKLVRLSLRRRKLIYAVNIAVTLVCLWGMYQLKPLAYLLDDLPSKSPIRADLKFFENNFKGVMPIEIVIDTKKPKGLRKKGYLQRVDSLETALYTLPYMGRPLSVVSYLKSLNQVYYNNDTNFYSLPSNRDWVFFQKYLSKKNEQTNIDNISHYFIDSTEQLMRISFKMADLGSIRAKEVLEKEIKPTIKKFFGGTEIETQITGTLPVFVKGNTYLINSLLSGMIMAVFLVALAHSLLFTSLRLIVISLVPNIIPMIVTAGLMGFFGIPLKPSTMIIFSIVLGIAVDNTVHFLAHYRMQLDEDPDHIHAVITSIKETGFSMIYTSVVLFAGFITFAYSEFGGTIALGTLTSVTLLVALFTNLTILPALLISFDEQKPIKTEEQYVQEQENLDKNTP